MQRRAKVRDGSPSCPKAFSGELKPSTMTGLSVCNVSTVGESLTRQNVIILYTRTYFMTRFMDRHDHKIDTNGNKQWCILFYYFKTTYISVLKGTIVLKHMLILIVPPNRA